MSSNATIHPWRTSLAWSATFRAVGVSLVGFTGWLCFSSADGLGWKAISLTAVLTLATLVGVAWYLPRARWLAALDHYADREQVRRTYHRGKSPR